MHVRRVSVQLLELRLGKKTQRKKRLHSLPLVRNLEAAGDERHLGQHRPVHAEEFQEGDRVDIACSAAPIGVRGVAKKDHLLVQYVLVYRVCEA